jgi:26S proteasome regulatory subunit N11
MIDKEASAPKEKNGANGYANGDAMDVEEEL